MNGSVSMCGIAGIYRRKGEKVEKSLLGRMCDSMRHRGPDDEGYYVDHNVGLCMRRLSIIDLKKGKQPIHNEDETIWVVFNGEIYNFRELRKDLEEKHSFYTNTDTEVLVHLYEEHGEKFVRMLNGMFAFALWDKRTRVLYIVRDRVGIKPLYYTELDGMFLFASEIKSILETPFMRREIDLDALACYFTFLYTPAPLTMFKGIKKLLPGHMLILENGKVELKQYWDIRYTARNRGKLSALTEEFLETFRASVKRQLISDVPIGAFLSGGIDSSAIVTVMSELLEEPVETFSIGYGKEEAYYDEREDAKLIATKCHTNHHEFIVKPDIICIIPKVVKALDEPLADASVILNYYISEETRKYVKVALSGLGGDELCGGYPRYVGMYLAGFYKYIPKSLRENLISKIVLNFRDSTGGRRFMDRAKRFVKYCALEPEDAYLNLISSFDKRDKARLFNSSVGLEYSDIPERIFRNYFSHDNNALAMNRVFYSDLKMYLVDDLLTLTDKMSMANSLEIRVPFLDNELVEFMASVPPEMKVNKLIKKYLFKKAFSEILPRETISKQKKGFSIPLVLWFREDLREFIKLFLSKNRIESLGFFNWDFVADLIDRHFMGKENLFSQIWGLLSFCLWHAIYIENKEVEEDFMEIYYRGRKN